MNGVQKHVKNRLNSENHLREFTTELHFICKNDFPKKYFKNVESRMYSYSIWRNKIQCNANMKNIIDFDIFALQLVSDIIIEWDLQTMSALQTNFSALSASQTSSHSTITFSIDLLCLAVKDYNCSTQLMNLQIVFVISPKHNLLMALNCGLAKKL